MIQIGLPTATIDTPLEHLTACHRRIEERLDTLVKAADLLLADQATALAAIVRCLEFLDGSGALHTEDEECSLFPRLRVKLLADQVAYLDSLEEQHVTAGTILMRLKELVGEATRVSQASGELAEQYRECAEQLRSIYRSHIQSEDSILSALAKQSLSEFEIAEIAGEMRARRERESSEHARQGV